jgi:TonB family protein
MRLAGDLAEVALSDFLQIQAVGRKTCAVKIVGSTTSGTIYLERGRAVHAVCGGLDGEDAFVVLIAQANGYFQADRDVATPRYTLDEPLDRLLLIAQMRIEAGTVPAAPRPVAPLVPLAPTAQIAPLAPLALTAPTPTGTARTLQAVAERKPRAPRLSTRAIPFSVGAFLVLLGGAAVALWHSFSGASAVDGRAGATAGVVSGAAHAAGTTAALEASELTGDADRPPTFRAGTAPPSPDPNFALQPTIVCRVLVGIDGSVEDAAVYRSRVELERFEEAALAAVRDYRFEPAQRAGRAVRAWTNVAVRFDP